MNVQSRALACIHEKGGAPFPVLAEMKISACNDARNAQSLQQDIVQESVGGEAGEGMIETHFDDRIKAKQFQDLCLHRSWCQAKKRFIGPEEGTRMRLEGQHDGRHTALTGSLERAF